MAQFSAGNGFIGGGFSYFAPLTKADTSSRFAINVEYFQFTAANRAWGVRAGYGATQQQLISTGPESATLLSASKPYFVAPNLQRFFPIVGRFGVLAGLEAVFSYQSGQSLLATSQGQPPILSSVTQYGLNLNLFTGAYFRAADRLLLRLNIGAAGLARIAQISQKYEQYDVKQNTLSYGISPTYSIAGSSLSVFYRLK